MEKEKAPLFRVHLMEGILCFFFFLFFYILLFSLYFNETKGGFEASINFVFWVIQDFTGLLFQKNIFSKSEVNAVDLHSQALSFVWVS